MARNPAPASIAPQRRVVSLSGTDPVQDEHGASATSGSITSKERMASGGPTGTRTSPASALRGPGAPRFGALTIADAPSDWHPKVRLARSRRPGRPTGRSCGVEEGIGLRRRGRKRDSVARASARRACLPRSSTRKSAPPLVPHSGTSVPVPPISLGMSFCFGRPSRTCSTARRRAVERRLEAESRDGRRVDVDEPERRMIREEVPAARLAPLSRAPRRLVEGADSDRHPSSPSGPAASTA